MTRVGPGDRYDAIHLFNPTAFKAAGKVLHRKDLRNEDFDNRRASLAAPAKPGDYGLQYWNGETGRCRPRGR